MDYSFNGKKISKMKFGEIMDAVSDGLNRLNANVARQLERRLRKYTQDRLRKIKQAGVVSYAAEAYFPDYKKTQKLPALSQSSDKLQKTQHNIAMYKNFLSAKTSTAAGARNVIEQEELRVWGETNFFQDRDSRERFWSAYMEFINQHPEKIPESRRVQEYLAHFSFWREREFNADDLNLLNSRLDRNDLLGKLDKVGVGEKEKDEEEKGESEDDD